MPMKAKHLLNLVSDRLRTLPLMVLYLTDGCNSKCVTCDIWKNPRRNMDMALVEQLASASHDLQTRWVLLSGGEAMQHPQWGAIARRFRAAGLHTMLLTNGLLLKKQIEDVKNSVDEVIVSLDGGTAATYQAIRGVDAFDLVIEGIRAVRAAGIPVTTRTTVQRMNYRELPQIIEVAKAADVNTISFLTVDVSSEFAFGARFVPDPALILNAPPSPALMAEDIPGLSEVLDQVEQTFAADFATGRIAESPAKLRKMVAYFQAVLGEIPFPAPRCNAPHISTIIEVDGTLRPCYFLPEWGQLGERPLAAALNDSAALQLRQAYRSGQRPECERCVCPLYKGARSLLTM